MGWLGQFSSFTFQHSNVTKLQVIITLLKKQGYNYWAIGFLDLDLKLSIENLITSGLPENVLTVQSGLTRRVFKYWAGFLEKSIHQEWVDRFSRD
jgi:hypothetical protein